MSSHQPILSLKHVGLAYRKGRNPFRPQHYWALKDVSFDLYAGETLGIIGRNGVGKSTLLKLLANIIPPDRGEILNTGLTASLLSLQVGFVPYLTGRVNAILSGMLLGVPKAEIEERMPQIIEFSELGEFIDEPLRSYSTGMRARLGFAVALVADPDILLIDEVLGVGDDQFRKKSAAVMKEKLSSDKTIVLVSHNVQTMKHLCDRVVWIEDGRSVMTGPAATVLDAYTSALATGSPTHSSSQLAE
ncbi:MAG: ABC transporter ATP-binding protein [bacterium]